MHIQLDLSDDEGPVNVIAEVLAIIMHEGHKLYAVVAQVDDAPWYALIHEHSTALA